MTRDKVSQEVWEDVLHSVRSELVRRIAEKGDGAFASPHEAWGAVDEEVTEFKSAVQENDDLAARAELLDTIVACIWGVASMNAKSEKACAECGKTGHSKADHEASI
jgi:hypothetical protein